MALRLRSKSFEAFGEIPLRYTGDGENVSPPLKWSGVPDGTREFVLICEDPDAPTPRPFLHWLVYHLSANTTYLPEGLPAQELIEYPVLAKQGRNTMRSIGYTGPKPPIWHGAHHYIFQLYALNAELSVPPDATHADVLKAMKGHVIGEARLVGRYELLSRRKLRALEAKWRPSNGWGPLAIQTAGAAGIAAAILLLFRKSRGVSAIPEIAKAA